VEIFIMSVPSPPVPLKNHCSIIENNTLYVYSPDAFQILPLEKGGQWKQQENGVSVTGATCVKGGVDGDSSQPALYVIGGTANSSSSSYPGLQRYSIQDNTWTTITPVVPVTQNRVNHGAAYMNASSAIVVYAGSQTGNPDLSTETFLIELYPPYRTQSYSSNGAQPASQPLLLTYSDDHAVMVGGSSTNVNVFTFGPQEGWADLGVALTSPLPGQADAQCALLTLDDGTKILETFYLNQSPNSVTRTVIRNPGNLQASYGEFVGAATSSSTAPSSTSGSKKRKRQTYFSNFPTYNASNAPATTRTGFSLAQDDNGLVAIVGGDTSDSVLLFNQQQNGWLDVAQLLGSQSQSQTPLAPPTATSTKSTSSNTAAAGNGNASSNSPSGQSHSLTLLGAILGAICGLAAVLLIAMLWLRSIRRKRKMAEKNDRRRSEYPDDNKRVDEGHSFEDGGLRPLAAQGKPMGRSPIPSTVPSDDISPPKQSEKAIENGLASNPSTRLNVNTEGFGQGMFGANNNKARDKSPLAISRPFAPDLGHYAVRPSIDLGSVTPAVATETAAVPLRNISQRKTDEGWGKYFNANAEEEPRSTWTSESSRPISGRSKGAGGFWPGSGIPQERPPKSPKLPLRDSAGNTLNTKDVSGGSPSLRSGPGDTRSRNMAAAIPALARISNGTASSMHSDENFEDESVIDDDDAAHPTYSSGVPSSVHDAWTPVGNTWSGPPQRLLRPPSVSHAAYPHSFFPPPTGASDGTSLSNETKRSSIPTFPMPSSTVRHVKKLSQDNNTRSAVARPTTASSAGVLSQSGVPYSSQGAFVRHDAPAHFATTTTSSAAPNRPSRPAEDMRDYFGPSATNSDVGKDGLPSSSDMSWLNLGGDARPSSDQARTR
jgi:hypothetical protein